MNNARSHIINGYRSSFIAGRIKNRPLIYMATALGYAKPRNALAIHVDSEDKSTAPIQGPAYETRVTLINESGLYALILSSKLPQAKAFKRWVTAEVLPLRIEK